MQVSKLFVGNLKTSATNEKLFELFSNYGEVKNVNVIAGKGFAFVEMGSPAEAQVAKDSLNDTSFDGMIIRVDEAKPQKKKTEPDQKRRWKRF